MRAGRSAEAAGALAAGERAADAFGDDRSVNAELAATRALIEADGAGRQALAASETAHAARVAEAAARPAPTARPAPSPQPFATFDEDGAPLALAVHPNPATGAITLRYTLAEVAFVHVALYDALGREVAHPVRGAFQQAGVQTLNFDASSLAPGAYVWRVEAGRHAGSGTVTLVR